MSLPVAVTTEQEEATRAWIEDFFKEYDSPDIQRWVIKYFQPDAIMNLRDLPPIKGHKELCDYIEEEHAQSPIIKHEIKFVHVLSDRIYVQKKSTGIVKNDPEQKEITAKLFCVFWKKINEDKLSSFDVYFDASVLLERIKMYSSK
jgi:limonene-1,2-epoxide hydrolase